MSSILNFAEIFVDIYWVIQEERSIFGEMMVPAVTFVGKKFL
jgi:hypothetical protein